MFKEVVISLDEIQRTDLTPFREYVKVRPEYEQFFLADAGTEHYKLLSSLASQFDTPIIDLGTLYGSSAVALKSYTKAPVYTYDIHDHVQDVKSSYKNMNGIHLVLKDCNEDVSYMMNMHPELILLDIDPHDGVQEQTFYRLLQENKYQGLLLCDDIHLNQEMRNWWNSITHEKHDLTRYGHWSGTGIINFNPDRYKIIIL